MYSEVLVCFARTRRACHAFYSRVQVLELMPVSIAALYRYIRYSSAPMLK